MKRLMLKKSILLFLYVIIGISLCSCMSSAEEKMIEGIRSVNGVGDTGSENAVSKDNASIAGIADEEYDFVEMSSERFEALKNSYDEVRTVTNEPEKTKFEAFAVRDDGWFVLSFSDPKFSNIRRYTVCIYDENGVFQQGFSFMDGPFYLEWRGENIVVLSITEDEYAEFTQSGEMVKLGLLDITEKNIDRFMDVKKWTKKAGGCEYSIKKRFFLSDDFFALIKTDGDTKTVLYQAESGNLRFMDKYLIIFLSFFLLVGAPLIVVPPVILNAKKKEYLRKKYNR